MNKIGMIVVLSMMATAIVATGAATGPMSNVEYAAWELCGSLKSLLPVAAMLMVVVAGVIYTAGQVMGAETRARANVWATAALTGALIAVLITAIAPSVLTTIYPGTDASGNQIQNVC